MAAGPNLVPGRYDTPLSKGTPIMETSACGVSPVAAGCRMKVRMPQNRGDCRELTGLIPILLK